MIKLTANEQRVYDYIKDSIDRCGYAPSVRDIMSDLGFRSTSTVHSYLTRLDELGVIRKEGGKSRALHIESSSDKIPLIGKVTAGKPILAEEDFEGYIGFDASAFGYRRNDLFALRIKGSSMINAGIMNGDVVIVEKRDFAENGEIVVAMIGNEATVKRFFREEGRYRLQPENNSMKPIFCDNITILGKVIASIRVY